jgi:hypothetical protein
MAHAPFYFQVMDAMKKRLRDVIDDIDYYELIRIRKDLQSGGYHLKKFVDFILKEREKEHSAICSACSNEIDPASGNTFTMIFGEESFKKKATFCGKDCLSYFLNRMEDMKQGKIPKHNSSQI